MLLNIQALRALASYLVVSVHLQGLIAGVAGGTARPAFGHCGVDLFFVISGFIMVYTTASRETSSGDFFRHRIIRIVPLYWTVTLAVFGLALVAPSLFKSTGSDPVQLAKSLFFIPFLKESGLIQPVIFVGWTLNYEMAFYALFALSLLVSGMVRRVWLMAAVLVAASAAGAIFQPRNVPGLFYTNSIILEFGFGMIVGLLYPKMTKRDGVDRLGVAAIVLALVLVALAVTVAPEWHRAFRFGVPAMLIVGGALALEIGGHRIRQPFVQKLGDASYAIYLTHPFVTAAFQKAGKVLHIGAGWRLAALIAVALVAVTLVGLIVHEWVEKPLTRLAKVALGARPGRRLAEATGKSSS